MSENLHLQNTVLEGNIFHNVYALNSNASAEALVIINDIHLKQKSLSLGRIPNQDSWGHTHICTYICTCILMQYIHLLVNMYFYVQKYMNM